jgi:colanic acid/amylovoran biosynthesis glycosyltransferase
MPFKLFGIAPGFIRQLRKLKPVLIHAHFGPMGVRALPLARALNVPLIVTFHGYDATIPDDLARKSQHYSHRKYARRRGELQNTASLFIAVSRFVGEQLLRQGFAPDKIAIHYVGVDVSLFRPETSVSREQIVLFAGRLERVKGCDYVIQAMARVQDTFPKVSLLIIGDGSMRPELERMAKETLRNCRFLGFQPPEVVRYWMARACIFAAPGVRTESGAEEGLGLTLVEAQSSGLPVVGFASGGISEAVVNGRTGLLSNERNVDSLSQNITTLLLDGELRTRMGIMARQHVSANFNLRRQAETLEELFRRVVQEHSRPKHRVVVPDSASRNPELCKR